MTLRGLLAGLLALVAVLATWARRTREQPPIHALRRRDVRTVEGADGVALAVEVDEAGPAPTVVFVHGLLARAEAYDAQWEHLRGRARLVRYDHRGHGDSGRVRRAVDLDVLAADLEQVLGAVAPAGPLVLVGHSMGGMTVLALARRRPDLFRDRVRGVALIATGAGHDIAAYPIENVVRRLARGRVLAAPLWLSRVLSPVMEVLRPRATWPVRRLTRALMFGAADATPYLVTQTQRMLEQPPLTTLASVHGALLRLDLRDALPTLAGLPVEVLVGADDRLIRPAHSEQIARDLGPATRLTVLPGVGHAITRSSATQVNTVLDRLLERSSAPSVDVSA